MQTEPSTFSIFQLINLSNRIFKLNQLGNPVSEQQCYEIVRQLENNSISSEEIIAQIMNKDSQLLYIKYQLYSLFGPESKAMFQNNARPTDKKRCPAEISCSISDTSLSYVIKRIEAINSQARYIGVELGLVEQNSNISKDLVQKLESFPLKKMYKMLAKQKGSNLKRTKFITSVKNLLILQEMIMLLFGQIYNQMKKLIKELSKPCNMQDQNDSNKSYGGQKKSALSSCVQQFLGRNESSASQSSNITKNSRILPTDFSFTQNRLQSEMELTRKTQKKQIRDFGVCCFNI